MSIVDAVMAAAVAALQAGPAVAAQVERVRLRPLAGAATTAVVVRPVQADRETAAMAFAGPDAWAVRIGVECYARAAAGVAADVALDPVLQAVYARLMADPTLGGVLRGLEPLSLAFDFDADGEKTACGIFIFTARVNSGPSFN